MKKNIYKIILIGIMLSGCEKLTNPDGDLNISPNNPASTSYENVLVTAEVGTIIMQTGETSRIAGIFGGTHTGIDRQYGGFNDYSVTTSDFNDIWDDLFIHSFRNAKLTQRLAEEQGVEGVSIGIAQTLQALALGMGTSLYGDIPFEDLAEPEIENPRFESQADVYAKIQSLLDEAIFNLQLNTGRPPSGSEIFFDGDPTAWVQVAHTLKARYYLHTGDYSEALSEAQKGIDSPNNSMYAPHGNAIENANLNWQLFANETQGSDLVISDFFVSLILPDSAQSPNYSNYRGNSKTDETGRFNFLLSENTIGFQPNQNDEQYAGQNSSAAIVTYQENLLILAEAGTRAINSATGLASLNDFRQYMSEGGYLIAPNLSNLKYDQYVVADFNPGGIENEDGLSVEDALLREIFEERFVTLFGTIEVFNDLRRTIFDEVLRVPLEPNRGNNFPERFLYAQSEIDRNTQTPRPLPDLFDKTEVNR